MYFQDKVVWVTGASSGIGEALAMKLAKENAKLILSARRVAELERVQNACLKLTKHCLVLPLDLSLADELEEKYNTAVAHYGKIDVLINNGGISQRAAALDSSIEIERRIMEVNFFGTVALSKFVSAHMVERRTGQIAVVSSILGKFGVPFRSTYSASKHALQGYFESLTPELAESNVDVTLICPGYVKTNVSLNAMTKDGSKYGKMDQGQDRGMSPEACADLILRAIRNKSKEVYIGGREVWMVYIHKYLPALYRWLLPRTKPI